MKIVNITKIAKEKYFGATQEMIDWYEQRTKKHISFVSEFCNKLAEKDKRFSELKQRAKVHDDSKFEEPEMSAYIWTTWKYKCKDDKLDFEDFDPPENIDDLMLEATIHHVVSNSHHPEYHATDQENVINQENRDKPPEKMVDATKMPELDIAEMCCDWAAMSKERGGSPKDWAKKNVNVRWKFNKEQEDLIYEVLDLIWE